jgi:GNAT superfamily N-acetyltransferase
MTLNIRRATIDDAELLARLNAPVQQIHYEARPDVYKPAAVTSELIADFHGRLAREDIGIFIGDLAGEPIGYIVTQLAQRDDNPYSYATRTLIVDQLSINPDQRSKGYGEALMQTAFDLAKTLGIGRVVVGVWAFNERAIAFYERQGFRARDIRMEARIDG